MLRQNFDFVQIKTSPFARIDQFDSIVTSPTAGDELPDFGGRLVIAGPER